MVNTIVNQRDGAGDIISNQIAVLKKFKLSIFGVIGYKAGKNDAKLIDFLNYIRNKKDETLKIIEK